MEINERGRERESLESKITDADHGVKDVSGNFTSIKAVAADADACDEGKVIEIEVLKWIVRVSRCTFTFSGCKCRAK